MIFTKSLDIEDIKKDLDKDNDVIAIIGCETCVRVSGSGGDEKMKELALKLRSDGYNVKEGFMIPTACTPKIFLAKPGRSVNTILSLACSAGTSNLERELSQYKVVRTTEDIGLMIHDTVTEAIKITMPYDSHKDEKGNEYEAHTGKALKRGMTEKVEVGA